MVDKIEIRFLDVEDAESYRQLRLLSYQESPFSFSESYSDEAEKDLSHFNRILKLIGNPPEQFVLGAINDGNLVGFVKFRRDQRSKARHKSMIHAMYVHSDYRKVGVGQKIMDHLMSLVSKLNGLEQIHLWVLSESQGAVRFYERCGFESQGPLVKDDLKIERRYVDAQYMVKRL